jgi:hypothetical protein
MATPPRSSERRGLVVAVVAWVVLGGIAGFAGCRRGPAPPPGAVLVSGTITVGGAPLGRGTVQFAAAEGTDSGSARLDPQGRYEVWLQPREYGVAVIAYEAVEKVDPATGAPLPPTPLIPVRYFTPSGSGLTATVSAENRTVSFDLAR